jgi:arylsulfatase
MYWPEGLKDLEGTKNNGIGHVMDVLPTCLEVAGVKYPGSFRGNALPPTDGNSMWPLVRGEISTTNDTLFWEHAHGKAIRIGDWKMSALENKSWELFDLSADRTEVYDLSDKYPDKVEEMNALWEQWAREMGIGQ